MAREEFEKVCGTVFVNITLIYTIQGAGTQKYIILTAARFEDRHLNISHCLEQTDKWREKIAYRFKVFFTRI